MAVALWTVTMNKSLRIQPCDSSSVDGVKMSHSLLDGREVDIQRCCVLFFSAHCLSVRQILNFFFSTWEV